MRIKKVLSFLLGIALLMSLTVSFTACGNGGVTEDTSNETAMRSGVCGEGLVWMLDGDGVLTVSGNGVMNISMIVYNMTKRTNPTINALSTIVILVIFVAVIVVNVIPKLKRKKVS